jgi:hypothetical protein
MRLHVRGDAAHGFDPASETSTYPRSYRILRRATTPALFASATGRIEGLALTTSRNDTRGLDIFRQREGPHRWPLPPLG